MWETITTFVIGLIGGIAVGIQSPISGLMGQRVGGIASSFIGHAGGAIISAVLLFARGGENIREWRSLSWYMLGSGAFGVILYLTVSQTVPRFGAATAVTLIVVGQILMGILIDHFGWFGTPVRTIDLTRVLAAVLLLAGAYLFVRPNA